VGDSARMWFHDLRREWMDGNISIVDLSLTQRVERRAQMRVTSSIAPGTGWWRRPRAAAAGMVLLVVPYAVALVVLSRPAVQAGLRERIAETLQVQLGEHVALEGDVRVDPLLRVSFGPLIVGGATRGEPPFLRVERVRARARMSALLAGRVEPASVELSTARVVIGPDAPKMAALDGERRRAGLVSGERALHGGGQLVVRFRRLVVVVMAGGNALELGPVDGDVTRERDGTGERIVLDLHLPGGGRAGLDARRAPGDGWWGRAWASRLGPELVPPALRGGVAQLAGGSVSIAAEGTAAPDLASAEGHVHVGAEGIFLAGERIGPAAVGPIQAEAEGTLRWDGRDRHLSVAAGRVSLLGAIRADVDGDVRLGPGHHFSLSLRAAGLDFAAAVAALPDALAPPSTVPRPGGTLDARAVIAGPLLAPSAWTVSAALDLSRMRAAARAAPPVGLRAPFVHRPSADGGAAPAIAVGPANPDFVPIAELPVHVVRAITTSEDGGFFGHQGFDFEELRNAFAEGAAAGRVVRGGSTITQQVAKNLYLTREKTLTRKVREAAITLALEAAVPKERLLEIYLNVVEWGPGIWGLGPAARHWFGKDARELTPMEAAFLASIIPNPIRYHFMYDRGAVSEAWRRRVDDVLLKMAEHGVIGDEDLARALAEPVVFARG
jgi:penicillin-binding protein 1A